jgi:hypothetical protein
MAQLSGEWRGARATSRIPNGLGLVLEFDAGALGAEPTMVLAGGDGSKGRNAETLMPRFNTCTHPLCI